MPYYKLYNIKCRTIYYIIYNKTNHKTIYHSKIKSLLIQRGTTGSNTSSDDDRHNLTDRQTDRQTERG